MTTGTGGGTFTATPSSLSEAYQRIDSMIDRVRDTAAERDLARTAAVDLEQQVAVYLPIVREAAHRFCWNAQWFGQPDQDPGHSRPCAPCDAREALSRFDL